MNGQRQLNIHMIFESALMLFTQNYQNQSMPDKSTACQSWRIFLRHSVVVYVGLITPPSKTTSPFLEPQQTENATDTKVFLENICDRNASIEQFLASLITYTSHE